MGAPLTEADLDAAIARQRRPLPAGCDQQGRFDTRPHAAEAATEIGVEQVLPPRMADSERRLSFYSAFLPAVLALTAVGAAAFIASLLPLP